ncbi:MAG TPA: hypothetical protein VFX38_00565, partial [Gammaproteobacteria bacterium]|nr:hypothetical protein [Gammaproteobacteria bacterium]
MHIIVIRPDRESRRFTLGRRHAGAAVFGTFTIALAVAIGAYLLGHGQRGAAQSKDRAQVASLKVKLAHKTAALTALQTKNQGGINAIAARMARLDAQVNQVAAMSAQVVKLAGLKNSSFDFNAPPGEGGAAPAVEL